MHLLVDHSREGIQNRLVSALFKESLFDELLQEDQALTGERQRVEALLKAYRQAFDSASGYSILSASLFTDPPSLFCSPVRGHLQAMSLSLPTYFSFFFLFLSFLSLSLFSIAPEIVRVALFHWIFITLASRASRLSRAASYATGRKSQSDNSSVHDSAARPHRSLSHLQNW